MAENIILTGQTMAGGVIIGDPVYYNIATSEWTKATILTNEPLGVCYTTTQVALIGLCDGFAGLTPGAMYYMADTGGLTMTRTETKIGYAKSASAMFIDIDKQPLQWDFVIGTTQAMNPHNGYSCMNAGLTTLTLPADCNIGQVIRVEGYGAGGWKIAQNASQQIIFGDVSTTLGTGGYLQSDNQYDGVELLCVVVDTIFKVVYVHGGLITVA